MRKVTAIVILCLGSITCKSHADENARFSVVKIEVQSDVPVNSNPVSIKTIARARLKPNTGAEKSIWFEIDDPAGYGKIKLGMLTAAVTSARQVDIATVTTKGWVWWSIDPSYNTPVTEYCYLVSVNQ